MKSHTSLHELIQSFQLNQSRVGVLCNQTAFVFEQRQYLIEVLAEKKVLKTVFVPKHGLFSELQDQEPLETTQAYSFWEDVSFVSLYGHDEQSLKAAPALLEELEDIIIDIQDVGCRYFTYLTTIAYLFETLSRCAHPPRIWLIDHHNPADRQVEGTPISRKYASFIGHEGLPHRHGLTLGELAVWLKDVYGGNFELNNISPHYNDFYFQIFPSPNFPSLQTAHLYSGQCLFEATVLSEGRGTTRPFEIVGAPFLAWNTLQNIKRDFENWTDDLPWVNYVLRPLQFIPTFHKYANELCGGFQVHLSHRKANHSLLSSLVLLRIFNEYVPNLWREGAYEKGNPRTALEILVGDEILIDFVQGKGELKTTMDYLKNAENEWIQSVQGIANEALFRCG
ncbi:DUF1343 domain-containing protein [Runella sp.]|uniref:DUF1343 domain-containing protein n=1 Tax=Runella sp. TaxID=1960881 RepID=UPI00263848C3|nr:DUF1343 domain-containing protein [Runella sp.]